MPAIPTTKQSTRAFTLVELLAVIGIIALLVGLLIPAISGVRRSAREAATKALLTDVSNSISRFQTDNNRLPGYFSATEMGQEDNADRGLGQMENAMLELAGGLAFDDNGVDFKAADPTAGLFEVTPYQSAADGAVTVDVGLIGSAAGGQSVYFPPPENFFEIADEQNTDDSLGAINIPDLVDANGVPVLLWSINEQSSGDYRLGTGPNASDAEEPGNVAFARLSSGDISDGIDPDERAAFYLNQNAGFVNSVLYGNGSLLNEDLQGADDDSRVSALTAMLGATAFPGPLDGLNRSNMGDLEEVWPSRARGSFVLQTAGADKVYMGVRQSLDPANTPGSSPTLRYGLSFWTGNSGNAEPIGDVMSSFDDLVVSGGN